MKSPAAKALLILLVAAVSSSAAAAAEPTYRVIATLGDKGEAPALAMQIDAASRRLYAAREGGVDVYDLDAGKRVGGFALAGKPGGLELAPDLKRGFVSSPASGTITPFDLATLSPGPALRSGGREPRDLEYDAPTKRLYVSQAEGGLVVLEAGSLRRLGTVPLRGRLRQAVTDGRGNLFVADESANLLHVVDTATLQAVGSIDVWPGEAPTALTNDAKERRIYVACGNGQMIIVDPDPGQMIGTVPTGGSGGSGMAMQIAPARLVRLYMPDESGRLNVIQNAKLTATLERSVDLGVRSQAAAFDEKTARLYVAGENGILVVAK